VFWVQSLGVALRSVRFIKLLSSLECLIILMWCVHVIHVTLVHR